jgi:uncharacterized protein
VSDLLNSHQLAKCFVYATDWLGVFKDEVNALNVYPVPDGDTGTNMHLTMQSVRRELDIADQNRMSEVARAISYGSLLGARGKVLPKSCVTHLKSRAWCWLKRSRKPPKRVMQPS